MKRTLRLRKETLTELTAAELGHVAAAGPPEPTPPIYAPTRRDCPTDYCTTLTQSLGC